MKKTIHSGEQDKLTTWLRKQREEKGLSMRELAVKLDKPHSFVGKVEQGERRLDVIEYVHYCKALGVSPITGLNATFNKRMLE